jgi:predicted nucleotidyltransferase
MTDTTQTRVAIRPELEVSLDEIADFCRRHHIRWLALFGSVLRDDFTDLSDVDVLIKFEPETRMGLDFFALPEEFSRLVGDRSVDMMTVKELNRWIRGEVMREAKVLYNASE